jgi:prepilin-type N-terminal cleavage/methylation domain-containing protein
MRSGVTLVELLVVLVILSLMSGMVVGNIGSLGAPRAKTQASSSARVTAIRSGRSYPTWDSAGRLLLFLPDGRVLAPGVDPLTGRANAER